MRRLRIAFVLLAVVLAVPLGLLVSRALASVALERATQHRAVAERVFDEMERALSRFLEGEEERPFEAYRASGPGDVPPPPEIAASHAGSFVVGHFQIEPDGAFGLPAIEGARVGEPGEKAGKEAGLDSPERIESLVLRAWAAEEDGRSPSISEELAEQAPPGGTIELGRAAKKQAAAAPDDALRKDQGEMQLATESARGSAFDLLRSLNRAGQDRAERKQKVTQAPYAEVYGAKGVDTDALSDSADSPRRRDTVGRLAAASPPRSEPVAEEESRLPEPEMSYAKPVMQGSTAEHGLAGAMPAIAEAPAAEAEELYVARSRRRAAAEGATPKSIEELALEQAEAGGRAREKARAEDDTDAERESKREVRITLDPMVGRRIDERYIVLSRTVLVGEQGYRQGFLVDTEALGRWLEERVLGANGLAQLGQAWFLSPDASAPAESTAREFAYEHRFEEPFDSLRVLLALEPLPGTASTRTIYQLAGLVALLALGGLAAVYRMVAVVVSYAERRNQFVAAVSHELKTPLTSIRMYAEMLKDGFVPEGRQREDYYATIHGESERLSRLIDNVLEFSRLERGSREFDFTVGDVGPVIREAAETLRPHVEREGFSLMVAVEEDLPPVRFDRDAVLQVLFNLVDNSLKYACSAEQREVAITCLRENEGVALSVRDFGPGVPRRHHTRIFEAFYRGENELTRSAKGSGIGLALVKELTEAMGAALQSGNAEGGGFRVSLRFAQAR